MVNFIGIGKDDFLSEYKWLYRFISFERLLELLENQSIAFLNPTNWTDPYERYYIEKEYVLGGKLLHLPIKNRVFCLCMSGTVSSEAFWKVYIPKEDGVRLSINTEEFIIFLESIKNCNIYIGEVTYETTKVFLQLSVDTKSLSAEIENKQIGDQQLKLLLRKRSSFRYEDEVRIMIVPDNPPKNGTVLKCPTDIKLFAKSFLFDPRMGKNQYDFIAEYMWDKYKIETSHSHLYKTPLRKPIKLK